MKQIIIFILITTISLSCTKDNPKEPNIDSLFLGTWTLNLLTGDFFMPEIYENGNIIFDFREDSTVHINFNIIISDSSKLPFQKDTILSYQFDATVIQLGGIEYDYLINNGKLTLGNNTAAGGLSLQFGKCDTNNPCNINNPPNINNPFLGEWTLNLVTGDFFMPEMYENGDIIFDFREDNTVHIDLNKIISDSSKLPFQKDTILSYQFDATVIQLEGMEYDYVINNGKLTLGNNTAAGGLSLQFGKCDTDNPCNTNNPPNIDNPFLGEWNLNLLTGGFFMPEMYENGDIIFDFKEDNNVDIKFKISIPASSRLPIQNDTVMAYQYDTLILQLGGINYDYLIDEHKLTIGKNAAADGVLLEFNK